MSSKNKLMRFAELETFENVIQPKFEEVYKSSYKLKGKWNKAFFNNHHPVVLELGCGKGEYTVGLAERYPEKNFIGIDIKGARMWRGAKTAIQKGLENVGFVRTRIELIESFFTKDEVGEIWITFPDPQLKIRRRKKRLTSSRFLNHYKKFLKHNGIIHLKTDSLALHEYTLALLRYNNIEPEIATNDLYHSGMADDILSIRTFYESQFLDEGLNITYLKFHLPANKDFLEPPVDDEDQN